jgi:CBS domain-containing protein
MPVKQIMITDIPTVEPEINVKDAAAQMEKSEYGCLVVVEGAAAVGIVTEKDIVQKVTAEGIDPTKVLIEDIMSSPLITISVNSTVRQVSDAMRTYNVRKIVVKEKNGVLVGLVTSVELAKWCSAQSKYSDPALNALAEIRPGEGPYD